MRNKLQTINKEDNVKRLSLVLIMTVALVAWGSAAWAQPYTPNIANDFYGAIQGSDPLAPPPYSTNNTNVPTPQDDNDHYYDEVYHTDINDAINLLLGTDYYHNSDVDFLQYLGTDNTWLDLSPNEPEGTFIMIGLTAGNNNTLGVYDVTNPTAHIPVVGPYSGYGLFGEPFPAFQSTLSGGTNFGWYLDSFNDVNYTWNSNPFLDDNNGWDHMMTYDLGSYLAGETISTQLCVYVDENTAPNCGIVQDYIFYDPYLIVWEDLPYADGYLGDEDFDDMMFLVDRVMPVPEPISMMLLGPGLIGLVGLRRKRS